MPLNSYLTLGNSGLRVSPFCLGTMTFGEDWGGGAVSLLLSPFSRAIWNVAATSSTPPTSTRKAFLAEEKASILKGKRL